MGPLWTWIKDGTAPQGWMPIIISGAFALAGAVALGYVLLWFQENRSSMSLFDHFEPRKEYSEEEKLEILTSLRTPDAEVSEEEREAVLQGIEASAAAESGSAQPQLESRATPSESEAEEYEQKMEILRSLRESE